LCIEIYPCYASLDLEILRQFSIHFVIANSPTWLIRSSWNFVHCKILIWRCAHSYDIPVHWALTLLCFFGLRNFETIQYALYHRKFSYMINQKFMKLCTLQDPNMKMCTLVVYPGPSRFPRIMSLKVVFQICFGSIKMMGMRGVLVLHSRQLSYSIYVSMWDSCVQQYH
jgi:hypothetical protein